MSNRSLAVLAVFGLFFLAGSSAQGAPIRFGFTGHVTDVLYRGVRGGGSAAISNAGIEVGTLVSGSYLFESSTPDSNPDPRIGQYSALISGELSVGSHHSTFSPGPHSAIGVTTSLGNTSPHSRYYFLGADINTPLAGFDSGNVSIDVANPTSTSFLSADLLVEPPDLADFPPLATSPQLLLAFYGSSTTGILVDFDDFFLVNPEPSSGGLLALGLLLLAGARRRS